MGQGPNAPYTKLDQNHILQRVFEEDNDRLRVDAEVSAVIGTVECVIDAASGDNIAIANANGNTLKVESNGSINVNIIEAALSVEEITNTYAETTSVASGVETTLETFTASSSSIRYSIQRVEFSGEQIALYKVYINSDPIASKRTHHGSGLSGEFEFFGGSQEGLFINTSDVVSIKVLHNRPGTGDFEARIQMFEQVI